MSINMVSTPQLWTVACQKDWNWASTGIFHISRVGTGTVVDCRIIRTDTLTIVECGVSVGLILEERLTVSYQGQ